jgi:hypothetical protein
MTTGHVFKTTMLSSTGLWHHLNGSWIGSETDLMLYSMGGYISSEKKLNVSVFTNLTVSENN